MAWMDRKGLNPNHAVTIHRNDITRESLTLARSVSYKLMETELQRRDREFASSQQATPYHNSAMPRAGSTKTASQSALSSYHMLTSASALGLRNGSSTRSLRRSPSEFSYVHAPWLEPRR